MYKVQSVCVNPGEENMAETGHCKVTGGCRQDNVVLKGNENKVGIGSSFITVEVSVKQDLRSYVVGSSHIYLKRDRMCRLWRTKMFFSVHM